MSKKKRPAASAPDSSVSPFSPRAEGPRSVEPHVYGVSSVCLTDKRGFPTPQNRSPLDLVLDNSEGFIPLWDQGVTLRWRFNEFSMDYFDQPEVAKNGIRRLLRAALMAWGDACPVRFSEVKTGWDFEIVMQANDSCTPSGCTLARAFFPDRGRHDLALYPRMFAQSDHEQRDTMAHELGHVFGLRHFFAEVSESAWPSVRFGEHRPFSIMNYGSQSELTETDRQDLKRLYESVWSGSLRAINQTPIRLMRPYHESITTGAQWIGPSRS